MRGSRRESDEASWKLHREIAEDWTRNHNYQRRPDGGECFLDIQDRFVPFIESLKHGKEEYILLVGHGGLFQLMLPLVLSNVDNDFVGSNGIGHTVCVVAEYISGEFVYKQWGEVRL